MSFSIVILTLNEQENLPFCLASLAGLDDVVVLDSFSTDRTVGIAKEAGARVVQRHFKGYADQRNSALSEIEFKHSWVLMLDADETLPADLRNEILVALKGATPATTLFKMRRKDYFNGKWLHRSSGYPTWFSRLMRVGRVRFSREVNEVCETEGQVFSLQAHIEHRPLRRGLDHWFQRHNTYSTMEARVANETAANFRWSGLYSSDPSARRAAQKALAYRLPLRPLLTFLWLYVFRGGFLDGAEGLRFASMKFVYEIMIDIKRKTVA